MLHGPYAVPHPTANAGNPGIAGERPPARLWMR